MTKDEFTTLLTGCPEAVGERTRLANLLNDFFPQEPKLRRILLFLHELDIHTEIENAEAITKQFAYRLFKRLIDEYDVSNENAYFCLYLWCECYGHGVLGKDCHLKESYTDSFMTLSPADVAQPAKSEEKAKSRDDADFYVNTAFAKQLNRIYIPCGFDKADNGYYIHGIVERKRCTHEHADIYALIYNYIIRNSLITDNDRPNLLKNRELPYELIYENVFRLETIILQLIKNNYVKGTAVNVSYDGYINELKCAIDIINDYAFIFCRLAGISKFPILKLTKSKTPVNITLSGSRGVYIKKSETASGAREIWYGHKIKYSLDDSDKADLEYLLSEVSKFDSFLPGQFEALCGMLNAGGHSLCQMPPGSGKSLIMYMAALLQPLPVFIVTPEEEQICGHLQELRDVHCFDNVSHLRLTSVDAFSDFEIWNSLLFLTPVTFQNRALLERFRLINEEMQISYVVFDKAECLSDRERGFLPECLMLCAKLVALVERVVFLVFTSAQSSAAVQDISRYLALPQKNIYAQQSSNEAHADNTAKAQFFDKNAFITELLMYQAELSRDEKAAFVDTYPPEKASVAKRYLYMLFVVGYVEDWYVLSEADNIAIMIIISTSEDGKYLKRGSSKMFERVQRKTLDYFEYMDAGDCAGQIAAIKRAINIETIIDIFADWYYSRFIG